MSWKGVGNMIQFSSIQKRMLVFLPLFIVACNKKSPTESKPKPAQIRVSTNTLNFTNDSPNHVLSISNQGDEALIWKIGNKPKWIELSKDSGNITLNKDTVILTSKLMEMQFGEYSDKMEIKSNGGDLQIALTLSYQPKIEIYPGSGVAKINLNSTYSSIKSLYGSPVWVSLFSLSGGEYSWWHGLAWGQTLSETWLDCYFENNSTVVNGYDSPYEIAVSGNYKGLTESLIGIGSQLTDVVTAFGQPDTTTTGYWDEYIYNSKGITFVHDSTTVTRIHVYKPTSKLNKTLKGCRLKMEKLIKRKLQDGTAAAGL
jgi:hypothetical protein